MKKSMLNVIILALVLINLILTVLLTFSLVSTNNKTNKLISRIASIIDLDVGPEEGNSSSSSSVSVDDIEYVDVTSGDSPDITISYTDSGKTHYAVLNISIGVNKKSKDYSTKMTSINNSMKLIVSQVNTEALKYSYNTVTTNKTTFEKNLLSYLQEQFQTDMIYSVTLTKIVVQ
jgi:flagellar FliL protein